MRRPPYISIVVPCHNGAGELRHCLAALAAAELSADTEYKAEYIVVDDGSTDDSVEVALSSELPIRLMRMGRRCGSPVARNAGARAASGDILIFLDADVTVHHDTIGRIAKAFADDETLGALIGCYDNRPTATGFYSQYRNLLHAYTHSTAPRQGSTFWTGCGAIRRKLFWEQGGFSETPGAVDDIELGARAVRAGVRIEVRREVLVTHRKRWTLLSTLRTDLVLRGIPWTLVILRDGRMPDALNVSLRNRFSVGLVWLAALLLALAGGLVQHSVVLAAAALGCLGGAVYVNRGFYASLQRAGGTGFALRGVPAHLLHFLLCGFCFLAGVGLFLGALAISRPAPTSLLTSGHHSRRAKAELPSYAGGD